MAYAIPNLTPIFAVREDKGALVRLDGQAHLVKSERVDVFDLFNARDEEITSVRLGPNLVAALVGWSAPCDLWTEVERQADMDRIRDSDYS